MFNGLLTGLIRCHNKIVKDLLADVSKYQKAAAFILPKLLYVGVTTLKSAIFLI